MRGHKVLIVGLLILLTLEFLIVGWIITRGVQRLAPPSVATDIEA